MSLRRPGAVLVALLLAGWPASALLAGWPASAQASAELPVDQWYRHYLDLPRVDSSVDGRGVVVAVVDSGVSDHPDLSGSVLEGADLGSGRGSGRRDSDGHGTFMAGLIAAHGNGEGTARGVAPGAKILPVKLADEGGRSNDIAEAIDYAVGHGAVIVNVSLGGGLTADMIKAVERAGDADVLIIASVGNRSSFTFVAAPASMDPVLAVGAVDRRGDAADFSVAGPELDLMAPGVDIGGISKDDEYHLGSGTSHAAAIVSGAAALLRSRYPEMSAAEVAERLESTAQDRGPAGRDDRYGYGVLDIVAALETGDAPSQAVAPAQAASDAEAQPEESDGIVLVLIGIVVAFGAAAVFSLRGVKHRPGG